MFWQSHAATSASVNQLLDQKDVTLDQLLDEPDIIQECKAQNSRVVDFLTRQEVLAALVERLVTAPPAGAEIASQYRHPNLACEVLQCAIPAVLDRLADERLLLDRLCAPLRQPAALNPLLASFFSRTLALLLAKKTQQVLEFLRSQEQFVEQVLQHLGTSAIMDLLCHLVAGIEEAEPRQATLAWLSERRLVQRLALLVGDSEQPERQANAALVLVAVINGRQLALQQPVDEREPNPLLDTVETEEFVSSLVDAVLAGGRTETGLVNAIHVLLPLLDVSAGAGALGVGVLPPVPAPAGEPAGVSAAVAALLPRLPALHQCLVSPPARPDLITSWGRLSPPLGATRLQLARLTAALLATDRPAVHRQLAELGTMDVLLDLFFHFSLNNFLHSQVEQCVSLILESAPQETGDGSGSSHPLLEQLFTSSKLIQRILRGMEERDATIEKCDQNRCWRSLRGYGGHLVSMANKVVAAQEAGPNSDLLRRLLDLELPEEVEAAWRSFCDAQLRHINELNRPVAMPDTRHDSSNDSDFRGVAESQQAVLLKMMREGSAAGALSDAFGRVDDDFRELSAGVGPLGAAGLLSLAAEAESRPGAAELFEQQCAERLGAGGGGGGGGGGLGGSMAIAGGWPTHGATSSSSDEDEDEDDEEDGRLRMEVDMSDPWAAAPSAAAAASAAAMDINVWQSAPAADLSAAERDWANFDAFPAPLPPPPAAALGVSPDSQTSQGVAPPRPPGSGSPHFPVDFSSAAAFAACSPEPVPMVSSPPHSAQSPSPAAEPAASASASSSSDRLAGGGSDCNDDAGAFPSAASDSASPASPAMDASSSADGSDSASVPAAAATAAEGERSGPAAAD